MTGRFFLNLVLLCSVASAVCPAFAGSPPSAQDKPQATEEIKDNAGDTFMEEIPTEKSAAQKAAPKQILPDLTSIGVPVDPHGHILPLKNVEAGPVLPLYSRMEQTVEPIYQGVPLWGYPYGGMPAYGWNPYFNRPFAPRPTFAIGLGGGGINFGFGASTRPFYGQPYGPAPISPWFVPPVVMPVSPPAGLPNQYVYPPAYSMF